MGNIKVDVLVAEIGSTTTVINAFTNLEDNPKFIGQGQFRTTVSEGDVNIGLRGAIDNLKDNLNIKELHYLELLATSSAAGGLKMAVHGLVYDMTVKAAKEAALGAGANIHMVTAGKLRRTDLKKLMDIKPNIILIAGGVDYGERDTALYNCQEVAKLDLDIPIIYGGNIENQDEVRLIFDEYNKAHLLHIVDNVYPKIDTLNIEPTRKVIQDVFEEHIVHAPGMHHVREVVSGNIIPTPGAVMEASKLLKEEIGDLMTIDVGGATTDIHSVTTGTEEVSKILLAPEPEAKRSVEGDLGVYINMDNIIEIIGLKNLAQTLEIDVDKLEKIMIEYRAIPKTNEELDLVDKLTREAVKVSSDRHAGGYRTFFGGSTKTLAVGKDLTGIKWIVGTGGALTRLPLKKDILSKLPLNNKGDKLLPTTEAKVLIDEDYIMASLGVLSKVNKKAALHLMMKSLGLIK